MATTEKLGGYNAEAKKHFIELIDKSYNDPWVFLELYDIYLSEGDTANGIKTIDRGRLIFDEDANLKNQQIYIYSVSGRGDELLQILTENIESDPYVAENYVFRGKLHRNMEHNEEAVKDFEMALENDEENMDANYELGEMYYLKGAEKLEDANKLSFNETEKFNALNEEGKQYFLKGIPCWERIYEFTSDDKDRSKAAQFLLQLYLKTEQMDKYKELKAEFQ